MVMTDTKFHALCASLYDCTPDQINDIVAEVTIIRELQANKIRRALAIRDVITFNYQVAP